MDKTGIVSDVKPH